MLCCALGNSQAPRQSVCAADLRQSHIQPHEPGHQHIFRLHEFAGAGEPYVCKNAMGVDLLVEMVACN